MIESMFPILETSELDRALAFYCDALGGTVQYRFPPEGEPVYVSVTLGASSLGIGVNDHPPEPGNMLLWIYVDDVDATANVAAAAGATVVEPPADQPWGERTCLIVDPIGTRVQLGARGPADD